MRLSGGHTDINHNTPVLKEEREEKRGEGREGKREERRKEKKKKKKAGHGGVLP